MKKILKKNILTGNVRGLFGNVSGITGDASGLYGDASGITGNVSGLTGDIDDAELTDAERAAGVSIKDLIE